jgi:hypothetical protein
MGRGPATDKQQRRPLTHNVGPKADPGREPENPAGGRLLVWGASPGWRNQGALAETGAWKVVSAPIPHNALLAGCPFFRSISRLPKAQLSFGKRRPTYPSIKAGHLVRLEMENSDEKPNPCRLCRSEPERRRRSCRLCSQHGRRGLAGHADAAVRRILRGAPCRSTAGRAVEPRLPQTNCMKAGGHSRPFCCLQRAGGGAEVDAVRLRQGRAESEAIASDAVARATRVEGEIEGPRAELAADQDQPESASPKPRRSRPG